MRIFLEMDAGLRWFAGLVGKCENALECDAAEKLLAALEKRGDWVIGEMLHQASVQFIELMKNAPEALRAGC